MKKLILFVCIVFLNHFTFAQKKKYERTLDSLSYYFQFSSIQNENSKYQGVDSLISVNTFSKKYFFNPQKDTLGNTEKSPLEEKIDKFLLSEAILNTDYVCVGVKNSSVEFLQYLDKQNISLGSTIKVISREEFDSSLTIILNSNTISISNKIAENLFIKVQ